jgi:hypothetical protein
MLYLSSGQCMILPVYEHSLSSKLYHFSVADEEALAHRGVCSLSQLLEANDLTGRMTSTINADLLAELVLFPILQH